jgi:hypothetical protein
MLQVAQATLALTFFAAAGCDTTTPAQAIANPDPTRCIVSGEKLPAKPKIVEVQGKKYALCCPECEPALRKDPEYYQKNPGSGSMSKK